MHMVEQDVNLKYELAYKAYTEGDFEKSFRLYKSIAEEGYSNASLYVGECYYHGWGVEINDSKAIFWLKKVSGDDKGKAVFILGKIFGGQSKYQEAYSLYKKSSDCGYYPAFYKMAVYEEFGYLGAKSKENIFHLYEKAALAGHIFAKKEMGLRLIKGWGGPSRFFEGVLIYFSAFADLYRAIKNDLLDGPNMHT